jgi:hypothetical protein
MTTALLLFAATFGVVFALGLQSLNVNGGHRALAFATSFLIGASNLVLFKVLPGPTDSLQIAAYLLGGPFGILASMYAHPLLVRALVRRRAQPWRRPLAIAASPAEALCRALLDPEELGHAATPEMRNRARAALGLLSREHAAPPPPQPTP